jgi:hypothetical protein
MQAGVPTVAPQPMQTKCIYMADRKTEPVPVSLGHVESPNRNEMAGTLCHIND